MCRSKRSQESPLTYRLKELGCFAALSMTLRLGRLGRRGGMASGCDPEGSRGSGHRATADAAPNYDEDDHSTKGRNSVSKARGRSQERDRQLKSAFFGGALCAAFALMSG